MSSQERSPKRQRSSLSPSSPPYHLSKPDSEVRASHRPPHTPQSPSRMSSANYASPQPYTHTMPTPPLTAGLSSHMSAVSSSGMSDVTSPVAVNAQYTPMSMSQGGEGDKLSRPADEDDVAMEDGGEYRPTDHDRHQSTKGKGRAVFAGPLPLLCEKPHPVSAPHPSLNLVSLYALDAFAATVARKDPVTGEKTNKLRKSYEGKAKSQGLPGRNKPTDIPGELLGFMEWPDEGWYDQRVYGKELENAASGQMMAKLERALAMMPGRLPGNEHEKWKGTLGLEDGPAGARTPAAGEPVKNAAQQAMHRSQPTSMRASAPSSPRGNLPRPERANKKRRYDDASFEGYADGLHDEDGYSTGGGEDGRRNSASRKRRREFNASNSPPLDVSGATFNSTGMVGVRSS